MTLEALMKLLKGILKCHPEAKNADVWFGKKEHINYVGYDKRHKPARIKLEK